MMNNTEIWLERFHSLYKNQMRQAVSSEGMQFVHFEILQYLAICNRYSNTAQAVSEYLGQTKGSISQSIKTMEKLGYIERQPSAEDKRAMTLHLTEQGEACLKRVSENSGLHQDENPEITAAIKGILDHWQSKNDKQGFGQCNSCTYHQTLGKGQFQCGLTQAPLSLNETRKICREHVFASQ